MSTATLPTWADVEAAALRIDGAAHRTPVLTSRMIDAALGCEVIFKAEHLQRMGAFKFRGAFNALSRFSPEQRAAGVVAYSSGNHAQAIALAARDLDIPATIVMPLDAPASKIAATRAYGGEIVTYDRYTEDREAIGRALAVERGLTLIPPYDHPDVIAGQGTAAKELIEDAGPLDAIFAPLGGGGLLAGTALAAHALAPEVHIYGVEPEAGNDGQQSFRSGRIVHIQTPKTLADGAQTLHLGELTFPVIQRHVTDILTVSDAELVDAMRVFAGTLKQVVEPTGVLAFAGLRTVAGEFAGKRIGVIISGGNIDLARFATLLG
ncbi:MAG: threo-3-hydroxy-L-aspartate ammonia-lyase [Chloroflexota bacterium]|nr:threo-3-hydroxy-L-aspartate ammonia-lyase [Chloroflexota bacterium]